MQKIDITYCLAIFINSIRTKHIDEELDNSLVKLYVHSILTSRKFASSKNKREYLLD